MAGTIESPDPHQAWVDPETGKPTMYFFTLMEALFNGTESNSIGTILSGQNGIIAGTTPLTDVLIDGRGSLVAEQDAQSNNINTTASSGGGLVATPDLSYAFATGTSGTLTSSSIVVSISGGTPPYTLTATYKSGSAIFTESISGSPLGADGDITISWTAPWSSGLTANSIETITVTDDAAGSKSFDVSVTATDVSGLGGA